MTAANPLVEEEQEQAKKIVDRFVRRFGESYRLLVYHAAIPLIVTPELLNYLRHQFLRGQVPWVAEVDLLLSDLFNPVGYELYAMDTAVRAYLLNNIEEFFHEQGLEEKHLQEVALVLLGYIKYLARTNSFLDAPELEAQQWAAMVFLEDKKEQIFQEIKKAFQNCGSEAELARLTQITQELSPQLSNYRSLIQFAESVRDLLLDSRPELTETTRQTITQLSQDLEIDLSRFSKFPKLGIIDIEVELKSERGVDYTKLRDLLAAGEWFEAEVETDRVILEAAERKEQGSLDIESIRSFPCQDLCTIDQLWEKYSNGHFGFSVQKSIYQDLGGTREFDEKIWESFGKQVRWRMNGEWVDKMIYSLDAPLGHLPFCRVRRRIKDDVDFFYRLETCQLKLRSEKGVDYTKLRDLLAAGKWFEADQETGRVILKAAGREQEGQLREEDLDQFPSTYLRTIDRLWVEHSGGRFGFSVQKRIYQSLGGTRNYDEKIWEDFCDCVGWRVNRKWLNYPADLTFSLEAPEGHLPWLGWGWSGGFGNVVLSRSDLLPLFEFDVVTVNAQGREVKREKGQAQYFTEDLGNGVTLEMVSVPGGTFLMGSPEGEKDSYDRERPQHQVKVEPFFMGKYPVTQAQWRAIADLPKVKRDLDPDPSRFKGDNRPVERVNWDDAVEFCTRLSRETGREYRLPSEAEWEYACRAGTTTPFHFGETITGKLANYRASETYAEEPKGEYREETTPVGQFPPNAFGLYDMHGQVWEWCADTWHKNYDGAPTDGSAWTTGRNDNRSPLRGGSWFVNPQNCRSASRSLTFREQRDLIYGVIGFRVAFWRK